ncbi:hypothetical protein [Actinoalloteichus hymeniacidonis]|uniref:Uncharacterized protein n=1 Tax=Actinoalloteichus hymeniacidonis TaxID=340345 RepID=A0AAC9HUM6_9PSEU|nr:hypothetical protein [Actinoalloteichus hymeniacidonis]AOS65271.1 hypothetical protein TL08_22445 [Actinoalloteichus hymeniacidonis]MBB5906647.1 hypothetical protein [Actinoalloteichus hymeniacidonis]
MTGYHVILHANWDAEAVWFSTSTSPMLQHSIDETAELLALSADLTRELAAWKAEFQGILNRADARESRFPTPQAEQAWLANGKELAARIKQESPAVARVEYLGDGTIPRGTCVF